MSLIYHLTTVEHWQTALLKGEYIAPNLKEEGFIHCCEDSQVNMIKSRFYADSTELVMLILDTEKLTSQFIFEWSPSFEATFPHVYGPINLDAVVGVEEVK